MQMAGKLVFKIYDNNEWLPSALKLHVAFQVFIVKKV
jgi:hypothetical protein